MVNKKEKEIEIIITKHWLCKHQKTYLQTQILLDSQQKQESSQDWYSFHKRINGNICEKTTFAYKKRKSNKKHRKEFNIKTRDHQNRFIICSLEKLKVKKFVGIIFILIHNVCMAKTIWRCLYSVRVILNNDNKKEIKNFLKSIPIGCF